MKTGKTLIIPGTHNNTSLTKNVFLYIFLCTILFKLKKQQQKNKLMFQLKQFPTLSYSLVLAN